MDTENRALLDTRENSETPGGENKAPARTKSVEFHASLNREDFIAIGRGKKRCLLVVMEGAVKLREHDYVICHHGDRLIRRHITHVEITKNGSCLVSF